MNIKNVLLVLLAMFGINANAACSVCGNWALDRSDGSSGYLAIDQSKGKTSFKLEVYSGGEAPNQGAVDGGLKFKNGLAKYRTDAPVCKLNFKFNRTSIVVTSHRKNSFKCGFSNGVVADGKYLKAP